MLELRAKACFHPSIIAVIATIACVDAAIAVIAFWQLRRIHLRSAQIGWNRQKVFHFMIGLCNLGKILDFQYDTASPVHLLTYSILTEREYECPFPEILLLAVFLLLLSYWIDLCHQADDEDDEGGSSRKPLLTKTKQPASSDSDSNQRCLPIPSLRVGSRQRMVIVVTVVAFVLMIAFAVLIWIGMGKNPIDSPTITRAAFKHKIAYQGVNLGYGKASVYVDAFAVGILLLGFALACYGLRIYLKMSKVRSERASSEMWKVTGLASVSLVCFTTSALVALLTDIPVLYLWHQEHIGGVSTAVLLILYHFIGSSTPSAFILWVMRELPPPRVTSRNEESRIVTFISDRSTGIHNPQRWTNVASSQNQNDFNFHSRRLQKQVRYNRCYCEMSLAEICQLDRSVHPTFLAEKFLRGDLASGVLREAGLYYRIPSCNHGVIQ
ncbi:hypothetical protein Cgig2_029321 [Carnegiea gigantea]|uniref:THH1/TOM1/TOM3 domain-containing protein n=1 Tax=Carnegiea gigantea TaxID=171969 RepID=A0A9Q1KUJ4_9CARY|nr:hypothetical protein Cgig2_029321 [Carnegiea gigantea]